MKVLITNIILIFAGILAISCEDLLEEEPITSETEKSFYADAESARLGVNGVYEPWHWGQTTSVTSSFSHSYEFIFGDICSDDSEKGSLSSDLPGIQQLKDFTANGANANIATTWEIPFVVIARANMAISNLEISPIESSVKQRLIAESKFNRALAYFQLVRIWGGVPIFRRPPNSEQIVNRDFERAPSYQVYQLIEEDLNAALPHLPTKADKEYIGYADQGAAAAYLARAIMYQLGTDNTNNHTWSEVLDITDDFIAGTYGSYALASNYAEIFEVEGENNIESIWEIQMDDNGIPVDGFDNIGPALGSQWSVFNNPQSMGGWGFNTPTADLAASYENNDPRRACTTIGIGEYAYGVEMVESSRNQTGYYNRKMIVDPNEDGLWSTEKGSGVNIRKFRYADILLMNAEAAYHEGLAGQAVQRLEEIRDRASASTYPKGWLESNPSGYEPTGFATLDNAAIPSGGQSLLDFIYLERRREFGMEQLRFWDLVRTGNYIVTMDARYGTGAAISDHAIDASNTEADDQVIVNPVPVFPLPGIEVNGWNIHQNRNY